MTTHHLHAHQSCAALERKLRDLNLSTDPAELARVLHEAGIGTEATLNKRNFVLRQLASQTNADPDMKLQIVQSADDQGALLLYAEGHEHTSAVLAAMAGHQPAAASGPAAEPLTRLDRTVEHYGQALAATLVHLTGAASGTLRRRGTVQVNGQTLDYDLHIGLGDDADLPQGTQGHAEPPLGHPAAPRALDA